MFGRERYGLDNDEVGLADKIVTFPVNPAFASLNLAQAVLLHGLRMVQARDRRRAAVRDAAGAPVPAAQGTGARRSSTISSTNLNRSNFSARPRSAPPCWSICATSSLRMELTQQDIQTLHGVILAIAAGRKGPARGGTLDDEEAGEAALRCSPSTASTRCRASTARRAGLSKLLRRNPTQPERRCGRRSTTDRRFAGRFKRQTPVGRYICDFVSFSLRAGDRAWKPATKARLAAQARARATWLASAITA